MDNFKSENLFSTVRNTVKAARNTVRDTVHATNDAFKKGRQDLREMQHESHLKEVENDLHKLIKTNPTEKEQLEAALQALQTIKDTENNIESKNKTAPQAQEASFNPFLVDPNRSRRTGLASYTQLL